MGPIFRVTKRFVTHVPADLLAGTPVAIESMLEEIEEGLGPRGGKLELDHDLVRDLFEAGLAKEWSNDGRDEYRLDRWLAPRLHAAIRVPRRIAADARFWAWIASKFAVKYVHQRFARDGQVNAWRFTGPLLRNAVSRLWWAAEMTRNGADYTHTDHCLRRVRTAQWALELKYSWYRPAAIAFVQVAEGLDGSARLGDEDMERLSVRANAYLPLAPLEAIGFDDPDDEDDRVWWEGVSTREELLATDPPAGPADGTTSASAVAALTTWLRGVLANETTIA